MNKYHGTMKQLFQFIMIIIIVVFMAWIMIWIYLPGTGLKNFQHNTAKAIDGKVFAGDLDKETILLSGEWEFYWNRLLTDSEIEADADNKLITDVPGVWNKIEVNGSKLPRYGYGTYHLKITGLKKGEEIALYIPVLAVSSEVYADDLLIAKNGKVSTSKEGFSPSFLSRTVYVTVKDDNVDLIIHISNYIYARAGMWHSIYLGTHPHIEKLNRMIIYKDLFMIGGYITLAIYYLSLFLLRKEKQSLIFMLLCIGAVLRTSVNGDRAILRLITDFPIPLLVKFDYISLSLFYPVIMLLMSRRFPKEFITKLVSAFLICGITASFIILITPVHFFTEYVAVAEGIMFLSILYTVAALFKSVLHSRKNAVTMFISLLILLMLSFRDFLYVSSVIDSSVGEISAFGFYLFLLLESFAISYDYSQSYKEVEKLTQELIQSDKLKDKIRQTEMAFLQSQIKPHFLYNSLSVIDEYCKLDPEEASRLINSLAKYLRQSFDFENLESKVSITKELDLVRYYVDIERARFENLNVTYELNYEKDFFLPPMTIQPLIENAIRHGVRKKLGEGKVVLRITEKEKEILISVVDDGRGMPAAKLLELLSDADKGKSVGLLNIHSRLLHLYGQGLKISSEAEIGTIVEFEIPKGV